ncbi:MAG: phenylalanine--tRNA ligase subunit beta [Fimbriimonadales bacterium]|nr:MAG: phenylalanine--tRNA ligase beta subunit [Fimbriimonadales bacterium]
MRVPIEWLKDFVQIDLAPDALAERLTMAGLEVEEALDTPQGAVLSMYLTPNRGDCLSIFGIAREVYALLGEAARPTELFHRLNAQILNPPVAEPQEAARHARVEIRDPDLCPRYAARIIRDIAPIPAPAHVQHRLLAAGMRPINAIVDATNYVMLELGQPLHAFDLHTLREHQIIVRRAEPGERITTLDGQTHTLTPEMLMICDAERPVAVAGMMGGAETEVSDDTRHILIESAHFSPTSIRATARTLGLRTESSYRFERFVDPNLVIVAQHRVCELLQEWTGVAAVSGVIDVYPRPFQTRTLTVRLSRASRLLGFEVRPDEAHGVLTRLNLRPEPIEDGFRVQAPLYRADLQREEDLIEELGRILGYERIPAVPPAGFTTQGKDSPEGAFAERVRTILLSAGLQEIVGHTLEAPNPLQSGGEGVGEWMYQPVPLQNPMSDELSCLRHSLLSSLMRAADHNRRRNRRDLHLFEIGRVFAQDERGDYHEWTHLGVLMTGLLHAPHWASKPQPADFYALKGVVEHLLHELGIEARFVPAEGRDHRLHPARAAYVHDADDQRLGVLGELHPELQKQYEFRQRVYLAEFGLNALMRAAAHTVRYRPLPAFPPVLRDIAIVVAQDVPYAALEQTIRAAGGDWLESVRLFDRYTGAPVPEGAHSLAFALVFRDPTRTLTDEEVNARVEAIFAALETQHGAQRRG